MKKRNLTIDILRGIAAVSVLLGHAIQRGLVTGFDQNILFKIIYTYHMPLFVILSGYTFYLTKKTTALNDIIVRIKKLLIPLFVWSIIIYFMHPLSFVGIKEFIMFPDNFISYIKYLVLHPDMILWFLWIIFIYQVIFILTRNLKFPLSIIVIAVGYISIFFLPQGYFGISWIKYMFPYFCLGYFLSFLKTKKNIFNYIKYLIIPAIIIYILCFSKFNYTLSNPIIYYASGISGIIIIYYIVSTTSKFYKFKILPIIGKYSLELYLTQSLCLNIGVSTGTIRIISIFITASVISSVFIYLVNKNKILKKILYAK